MKNIIWGSIIAFMIMMTIMVAPLKADGCNNYGCTYNGYYLTWMYWVPYNCFWSYTQYYDGSYYYADSCGGNSSSLWIYFH